MSAVIKLDRERPLVYTLLALKQFKQKYGKPFGGIFVPMDGNPPEIAIDTDCMVHAIWAGLIADDAKITVERTERLLQAHFRNGGYYPDMVELVATAYKESGVSLVKKDDPDEDEDAPPAA